MLRSAASIANLYFIAEAKVVRPGDDREPRSETQVCARAFAWRACNPFVDLAHVVCAARNFGVVNSDAGRPAAFPSFARDRFGGHSWPNIVDFCE